MDGMGLTMASRAPLIIFMLVATFILIGVAILFARWYGRGDHRVLIAAGAAVFFFGCAVSRAYWGLEIYFDTKEGTHEWLHSLASPITWFSHLTQLTGCVLVSWRPGVLLLGRLWPYMMGAAVGLSTVAGLAIYASI